MFTPINTMCMLGRGTVFIITVCGKGRSKQELALICVCLEMGDLLQAPINTTCNTTGTH